MRHLLGRACEKRKAYGFIVLIPYLKGAGTFLLAQLLEQLVLPEGFRESTGFTH